MSTAVRPPAPRREIGGVTRGRPVPGALLGWSGLSSPEQREDVPELRWPMSNRTYRAMLTDAKIEQGANAIRRALLGYWWGLDQAAASDEVTGHVADDLGLPVLGARPRPRQRGRRFHFLDHLDRALDAPLGPGHCYFEQVADEEDEGRRVRLRKLAERPAHTISDIQVADDGGLVLVRQGLAGSPEIPVDVLVAYVWGLRAGNWYGRPMLRPMYRHWLVKDRLMRVDAMKHERNGIGVPIATAPESASDEEIEALADLAEQYRAGANAGAALPHGATLRLAGVEGQLPDTLGSIRYHDEQIAAGFSSMLFQLGSTRTGSRALGESFGDELDLTRQSIADWFVSIFQQHVIDDLVDWNWGTGEPSPRLIYEVHVQREASPDDLATMKAAGMLSWGPADEDHQRHTYRLPRRQLGTDPPDRTLVDDPRLPRYTADPPPDPEASAYVPARERLATRADLSRLERSSGRRLAEHDDALAELARALS